MFLERIKLRDPDLHAFVNVGWDSAPLEAQRLDSELERGIFRGILHGVPIAVKDNIATRDLPTTCNSRAYERRLTPGDAESVARLRRAGAIVIGKSNMNELAWSDPSDDDLVPPARNPWDERSLAALSSSGSAAAVASGLAPLALGTDAGGSVRLPASQMGLVGLKRTAHGASDEDWSSLSTVGVLGHTASDVRLVLEAIDGPVAPERMASLEGVGVGVPRNALDSAGVDDEVAEQFERDLDLLRDLGAHVTSVELPSWAAAAKATFILLYGLQFGRYAPLLASSRSGLGTSVRRRLMAGAFVSPADVARCELVRSALQAELEATLATGTVLIATPVVRAVGPSRHGQPRSAGLAGGVIFTAPVNLSGWPAVSVPAAVPPGASPVGLQLVAAPGRDGWLLDAASLVMARSGWQVGQRTFREPSDGTEEPVQNAKQLGDSDEIR